MLLSQQIFEIRGPNLPRSRQLPRGAGHYQGGQAHAPPQHQPILPPVSQIEDAQRPASHAPTPQRKESGEEI